VFGFGKKAAKNYFDIQKNYGIAGCFVLLVVD
jgi:hypothetical protein